MFRIDKFSKQLRFMILKLQGPNGLCAWSKYDHKYQVGYFFSLKKNSEISQLKSNNINYNF
jgi:hypothetical protein